MPWRAGSGQWAGSLTHVPYMLSVYTFDHFHFLYPLLNSRPVQINPVACAFAFTFPRTFALSDQPKDCTVTSRRFNNIFLLTSYSFTRAWFIASIFSCQNMKNHLAMRQSFSDMLYVFVIFSVFTKCTGPRAFFIKGSPTWFGGALLMASFS